MSNINLAQLCISSPKESNAYSKIYLADPGKKFLEKFGKLGILVNLSFNSEATDKIVSGAQELTQRLIDFISGRFYNTLNSGEDAEKEFEELLQKTNNWLQKEKVTNIDILEKYIIDFDIDIIVISGKNVYFSQIGNIKTYLISPSQTDEAEKMNELSKEDKSKSLKFSNIVSGVLEQGNVLIFTTKSLFDYFPSKKITQMLEQKSVKNVISRIRQLLPDDIASVNLLTLMISNRDETLFSNDDDEIELSSVTEKKYIKEEKSITIEPERIDVRYQTPVDAKNEKQNEETISFPKIKKNRNIVQKILLIVLIIFALLFIQSLIILGKEELRSRQTKKYAQIIEELRQKESELSVSLVYSDSIKTKKSFNEMKQLLNQLPQKTDEQKQTYQLFYNKYTSVMNKFYRLSVIEDPKLLVDLIEFDKNIFTGGLANIGNDFYILNPKNNYIYLFNIETNELEIVNETSANIGRLQNISFLDNDNLIAYDQNQKLAIFNTIDKKLIPLKLDSNHDANEISDLFVYNRRVYLLEPQSNQIYKYSKTIDGFGKEEPWIQDDNANISDSLTMAIDGSIYVLKKNGQILKFYQNKQAEFTLDHIEPALSILDPNIIGPYKPIKLFTDTDFKYIYLLDGSTKRLIIFSKNGTLVKQITSPKFNDLKAFIINKAETTAWFLNGTKIFEIGLR